MQPTLLVEDLNKRNVASLNSYVQCPWLTSVHLADIIICTVIVLFGGTVPPTSVLFGGTAPQIYFLFFTISIFSKQEKIDSKTAAPLPFCT